MAVGRVSGLLRRGWVFLVVIAVVIVSVSVIYQLRGIFGTHTTSGQAGAGGSDRIVPVNVKRVVYEIDGPVDTTGSVSYLDETAKPQRAQFSSLPWTLELTTTNPSMFANLVAQGDGSTLQCRITVDGTVRDAQRSDAQDAQVFCLVKAA